MRVWSLKRETSALEKIAEILVELGMCNHIEILTRLALHSLEDFDPSRTLTLIECNSK